MMKPRIFQNIPKLYFAALFVAASVISLEHLLLPLELKQSLVSGVAGTEYAIVQLQAFDDNKRLLYIHIISSLVMLAIMAIHLTRSLRSMMFAYHRLMGWIFGVVLILVTSTGVIISAELPFAGLRGVVPNAFSMMLSLSFFFLAVRAIRKKQIVRHHHYLLRLSAIVLGIALSRAYLPLFVHVLDVPIQDALYYVFWLGSGTNLLLVEIWIRRNTRKTSQALTYANAITAKGTKPQ